MQLTLYTDYSLRALVFLGLKGDELATVNEIASSYGISRNHLVKVVHNLSQLGYLNTVRGKGGGVRLARQPEDINIGKLVLKTEPHFNVVECFEKDNVGCPIDGMCALKGALGKAYTAFMTVLEEYTLADVLSNKDQLSDQLKILVPFPNRNKNSSV